MRINKISNNQNSIKFTNSKNSKNVTFSGKFSPREILTLGRNGAMTRNLFVTTCFAFMLSGRLITSRDNNERRETLTRDVPTIIISVLGVPVITNRVGKWFQKKSGFAIGEDIPRGKGKTPGYKLVNTSTINDWYKFEKNDMAVGFNGFSKRLADKGGNLKKIFSALNGDLKSKMAGFSDDNAKFMKELLKDKSLTETIENEMSKPNNKALTNAGFLKTLPNIVGFVTTISTVGIFLPQLNIFLTEKLNKHRENRKARESK